MAAGLVALIAAIVPGLPGGFPSPAPADYGLARVEGAAVVLLSAAAVLVAVALPQGVHLPRLRRADFVVASATPAAIAVAALSIWAAAGSRGSVALGSILIATPIVAVALPALLWVTASGGVRPSTSAALPGQIRLERWIAAALALGFMLAVALLRIVPNPAFGWDESVYAGAVRAWLQGASFPGWNGYRPPGLSFLGALPALLQGDESGFRLAVLPFGCLLVLSTWLLGRRIHGPLTGLLAAFLVATAGEIQLSTGTLLNDVPSAAVLVFGMAIIWRAMERGEMGNSILWAAPVAACAFYLRYGSVVPIAAIGVAMVAVWPHRLMAEWRRVSMTVGLFFLLLIPHLAWSTFETGSPWGVLASAGNVSGSYLGEALIAYLAWLPTSLVGLFGGLAVVFGLVAFSFALGYAIRWRSWGQTTRGLMFLGIPASLQLLTLGMVVHAEGRYVYFGVTLLCIGGAIAALESWRRLARWRRALGLGALVALVVYAGVSIALTARLAHSRNGTYSWLRDAGGFVAAHSASDCSVLAADVPQMAWYSSCATVGFTDRTGSTDDARLSGSDRWILVRLDGRFQPGDPVMAEYMTRVATPPALTLRHPNGQVRAELYRFVTTP